MVDVTVASGGVVVEVHPQLKEVVAIAQQGPAGSPGQNASGYHHIQSSPATSWVVNHGLGRNPAVVAVANALGEAITGDVVYNSLNTLSITFAVSISGSAYCI